MSMKRRQEISEILKGTSKREHKLYTVDFKTREYSVEGETYPVVDGSNKAKIIPFLKTAEKMNKITVGMARNRMIDNDDYNDSLADIKDASPLIKQKTFSSDEFYRKNYIALWGIVILAYFFLLNHAFARAPQGEFSALVENSKTRSDFKSKKEMIKFVKNEEKKYNNKKQNKGK